MKKIKGLKRSEIEELVKLLKIQDERHSSNLLGRMFPKEGEYARSKYSKQLEFFKAGKDFNQRAMIASNQSGKSKAGAYESTVHLT